MNMNTVVSDKYGKLRPNIDLEHGSVELEYM
jgi:hypothetical protein